MSKKYIRARVAGFFNDDGVQYILCNVAGHMFPIKNGDNGYAVIKPNGIINDGISYGGFAAIELEKCHNGEYTLKPIENALSVGSAFKFVSPHILIFHFIFKHNLSGQNKLESSGVGNETF